MSAESQRALWYRALRPGAVFVLAAAAALLVGFGSAAPSSCCRWRHVDHGLLPATYVISLAIDARRPSTMYAGTIRRGVAKSVDAGARWRPTGPFPLLADGLVASPEDVMSLAADPSNRGTVYAGTNFGGVLKSVDGGANWRTINRGLRSPSSFGALGFFPVVSLVIDPAAPATVYAAMAGVGVFVSRSGGAQWRMLAPGLAEPRVESLALAQGRPRVLWAATAGGIFKNVGGDRWRRAGMDGRWFEAIALDAAPGRTVYAGMLNGGVYASADGGEHWRAANRGLKNRYVRTLLADPRHPSRIYAGTYGGVFASSDAGRRWSALNRGLDTRLVQTLALGGGRSSTLYAGTLGSGVFALELG